MKKDGIRFAGIYGAWYVIDSKVVNGQQLYLVESETFGDEAPCIIIDENYNIIQDDVYNGFDEIQEVQD
jgi:hypothetical protein